MCCWKAGIRGGGGRVSEVGVLCNTDEDGNDQEERETAEVRCARWRLNLSVGERMQMDGDLREVEKNQRGRLRMS